MVKCSAFMCRNAKYRNIPGITYHRFPKDKTLRDKWLANMKLPDWQPGSSSVLCSRHFNSHLIDASIFRTRLLYGAVPTIFDTLLLPTASEQNEEPPYSKGPILQNVTSLRSPTAESSHSSECCEEADEASSEELVACRACLAAEGRLYAISGSGFEDALATLTGVAMPEAECFPQHLCAFCRTILAKFISFRDSCQRSTALLQSLMEKGPLKMNDITAIDRDAHQLSNTLTRIKIFQFGTDSLVKVKPLIKTENKDKSAEETDYIEAEYLDLDDCENNDSNDEIDEFKCTFELPKAKQEKTEQVPLKWERIEIKRGETEYTDSQVETDDDIEINGEKYASDVDTETSEEIISVRKKVKLSKKKPTKTTKKKETYELPPPIDIKAFEKKYNVEYKFMNIVEQKQEIEERKANNALRYCCDMCGQGYRQECSMVNHLWIHDPRLGPYECDVCRKRFRNTHRLFQHRYSHRDRFTCRDCGLVSRNSTRAKSHHKEHQGNSYACPHCDELYARQNSLYNHIRARHPEQNVPCDECGETFFSALGVRQHKALAHRPITKENLKCKDCDVTFSSAEALQRHSELSAGVPHAALWPCAACGDSCGSEPALAAHAAEKHPPDQLHCDKCDKTFASAASFSLHEARKHRGERATPLMNTRPFRRHVLTVKRRKPGTGPRRPGTGPRRTSATRPRTPVSYVCEICGKALQSAHNLEYHRNVHLGIKPFPCSLCDKKFTAKISLQKHMLVHTGERPHQCEHCQQTFSVKNNLQTHINNVHYRMKATCEICGKSMAAASLTDHVRNIHLNAKQPPRKRDRKNEKKRKRLQTIDIKKEKS